jgi:hypothetical protein
VEVMKKSKRPKGKNVDSLRVPHYENCPECGGSIVCTWGDRLDRKSFGCDRCFKRFVFGPGGLKRAKEGL